MKRAGAFSKGLSVKDVFYSMLNVVHMQAKDDRMLQMTEELQ